MRQDTQPGPRIFTFRDNLGNEQFILLMLKSSDKTAFREILLRIHLWKENIDKLRSECQWIKLKNMIVVIGFYVADLDMLDIINSIYLTYII